MFRGASGLVKSTLGTEWSTAGSTVESLAKCDVVHETDENWQPLAKPEPIDDGGQAFPSASDHFNIEGVSLRMWLAAQFLKGILSNGEMPSDGIDGDVNMAFKYADAVIAKGKVKP